MVKKLLRERKIVQKDLKKRRWNIAKVIKLPRAKILLNVLTEIYQVHCSVETSEEDDSKAAKFVKINVLIKW